MEKERKTTKIEVNTTKAQKEEIKKLAKLSGKSNMSAYVLSKVLQKEHMDMKELIELLKERNKIQEKINDLQIKMKQFDEKIMNTITNIINER